MRRQFPKAVGKVVDCLNRAGYQAYPVGGGVRDLLLGKKVGDWDVATNAKPKDMNALFSRVIPTGVAHGTVTVMKDQVKIEVTTYRGDVGYTDGRHPDQVVFLDSIQDDLNRRDFTVNAMAYDLKNDRLIDPLGGLKDLRRCLIRAVGDPGERFQEDGLRPMRAIRFACVLDFRIDKDTFAAISRSIPIFQKVAVERIREELIKILASKHAARGVELLRKSGLLVEILPELMSCVGFAQNRFHRHDVYIHTRKSLEKARNDAMLKLAILLHDVGKPETAQGPPGEHTFYNHEKRSAEIAERVMRRLRFSNAERDRVVRLIENHMFHYLPEWTDGAVRRLIRRVGSSNLDDLWELRRADAWGRSLGLHQTLANLRMLKARVEKVLAQDTALQVVDLAIDGRDVMQSLGIGPGPRVGKVLDALLEQVLDDPTLNNPKTLKSLLVHLGF